MSQVFTLLIDADMFSRCMQILAHVEAKVTMQAGLRDQVSEAE